MPDLVRLPIQARRRLRVPNAARKFQVNVWCYRLLETVDAASPSVEWKLRRLPHGSNLRHPRSSPRKTRLMDDVCSLCRKALAAIDHKLGRFTCLIFQILQEFSATTN